MAHGAKHPPLLKTKETTNKDKYTKNNICLGPGDKYFRNILILLIMSTNFMDYFDLRVTMVAIKSTIS